MDRAAEFIPSHGDDARPAVAALYRRHHAELCRYARQHVESWDTAEDVVEDVFLRLLRRPAHLGRLRAVSSYLRRAVRNEALHRTERVRSALRRREILRTKGYAVAASPAEELRLRRLTADVDRAIEALPPRCRQAFLLIRADGITYAETAVRMGISVKTVEEQMRRAQRLLRKWLVEYAVDA